LEEKHKQQLQVTTNICK